MTKDGILIVDANALTKRQVGIINQLALAFHSVGAFVIFVECIKPNPTIAASSRLRKLGYNFDDIVHLEQPHYEAYDFDVLKFVNSTLENNSDDVTIVTGSGIVFQRLLEKGLSVLLHG